MKIGIIGAGNIGGTLSRKLSLLGHAVSIANSRGPETLTAIAAETGATAVSIADAVKDKELVIVTIPQKNIALLPVGLFQDVPADVVIADTGNYYPSFRDGHIYPIENGMSESRWVPSSSAAPSSKCSTTSLPKASPSAVSHQEQKIASPCPSPAMMRPPKPWSSALSKHSASMALTQAASMTHGASSPAPPSTARDLDADHIRLALSQADRSRSAELRELGIQNCSSSPRASRTTISSASSALSFSLGLAFTWMSLEVMWAFLPATHVP